MARSMFLTSTRPLADGTHELEAPHPLVWGLADVEGLPECDYGRTWFVYESRAEYRNALDLDPEPTDDIPEFGPLYAMPGVMVLGDTLGQWTAPDGFVMVGVPMTRKSAATFLGLDVETMDTPDYDPRGSDPRARGAL